MTGKVSDFGSSGLHWSKFTVVDLQCLLATTYLFEKFMTAKV